MQQLSCGLCCFHPLRHSSILVMHQNRSVSFLSLLLCTGKQPITKQNHSHFLFVPPIPSYSRPLFHHTLTTVCLNYFVSLPHPFFRTPHSMLAINSKSSLSSVRIQSWHQPSVRSLMRSFLCPVCPYSFLPLQACCS